MYDEGGRAVPLFPRSSFAPSLTTPPATPGQERESPTDDTIQLPTNYNHNHSQATSEMWN